MNPNFDIENLNQLKGIVSIDTLKAMQLLGFNYKKAIGEPLTDICAAGINSWCRSSIQKQNNKKRK